MHVDQPIRRERICELVDLSLGTGLEIGPLDSPLALREVHDVRYVDVLDTDGLRAHFAGDVNVSQDHIVEVDFHLQDTEGTVHPLARAVRPGAPYAWVVASHVVEHVPDLIRWLSDIADVLDDDGILALVVPDRRFTFDVNRPQTTVGQILQAHTEQDQVPSERAVFDHYRSVVTVSPSDLWAGKPVGEDARMFTLDDALGLRRTVIEDKAYVDTHVWLFTPATFVDQIVELGRLGLCDLVVEAVIPTAPNELEFFVALRRLRRGATPEAEERARAAGIQQVDDGPGRLDPDPVATATPAPGAGAPAGSGHDPDSSGGTGPTAVLLSGRELRLVRAKRSTMARVRWLSARACGWGSRWRTRSGTETA